MHDTIELVAATSAVTALRESELRYRSLFHAIRDPLFVYDRETLEFLAANDAAVAQYGYGHDELSRMTIKDIRPHEDVPRLLQMLVNTGDGIEDRGVWRHRKKGGTIIDVEIRAYSLEFGGRPACLVQARDVSGELRREFEMARTTALLQAIAEGTSDAVFVKDTGGRYLLFNEAAAWFVGKPPHEVVGHDDSEVFNPADARTIMENDRRVMTTGRVETVEEVLFAAGKVRTFEAMKAPYRDGAGEIIGVIGVSRDVTLRRETEAALRQSEERFRLLAKATHDAVWDWDMVTGVQTWNDGVEALFGYPRHEIEASIQFCLDRVHPDDAADLESIVEAAIASGDESWEAEYRFRRRDGEYIWVLDSGYIIRDESGTAVRMIGGMTDLTVRRHAEQRVAEQAALLDAAHDAIVVRDLELRITYLNKSAERLHGCASKIVGVAVADQPGASPDGLRSSLREVLANGEWSGELRQDDADGRAVVVASRWTLVYGKSGEPRAVLIISTDITEKKQLEEQFIRAQRLESIGTLAGGIAHDLNNILAPILGAVALLRDDMAGRPNTLETLRTLELCAVRGAELVSQVLSFSRGVEGERVAVDVPELAHDVVRVLGETLPKSVTLDFESDDDVCAVSGDSTQLRQVLLNLCVNARDATSGSGSIRVRVRNAVLDETYAATNEGAIAGSYVVLEVADTGTGMPTHVRERIFEPFFTTKDIGKGTGLGLSTTLAIVRSHGGFILVHSDPGRGARFEVHLPADTGALATAAPADLAIGLPAGRGEMVLVVDDEETIRKVVESTLRRFGYDVVVAAHGAEAVSLYAQYGSRIAVVLTDMAMPVMDGNATITALRVMNPEVRIVATSGRPAYGVATGEGVDRFVAKPYTAETLLRALREVIDLPREPEACAV